MTEVNVLLTIASSFLVLIISPGPNFLVITQISLAQSRLHGICTGLGVASGSITWAILASTGLGLAINEIPFFQPALQCIGGAYLVYIGVNTLRGAGKQPKPRVIDAERTKSYARAYQYGLATNMTNPKALAFYTSIFTLVTAAGLAYWVRFAGVAVIAVMAITWFVLLATLFSIPQVRNGYGRIKFWVDLVTGSIMAVIGLGLLYTAASHWLS